MLVLDSSTTTDAAYRKMVIDKNRLLQLTVREFHFLFFSRFAICFFVHYEIGKKSINGRNKTNECCNGVTDTNNLQYLSYITCVAKNNEKPIETKIQQHCD